MERKVLRIREVADILGMSPATIRSACRRGEIKTIMMAGVWLVPKDEIEKKLNTKLEGIQR